MNERSQGAYFLSMTLHAALAGLVLFFSYAATSVVKDTPKVFELVAGEGDNYTATVAPALGVPKPAAVRTPPKADASPIQPAPESVPAAAPKKPAAPTGPPDLVKQLKRVEQRRETAIEWKYQQQQKRLAAEEKRREAAEAKAQRQKVAHVDAEGIAAGVTGGSTENKTGGAGGKALSREEMSQMDAYFAELMLKIKEALVPPEGLNDNLAAGVEFYLAADGSRSSPRIIKSSGNAEFDRAVLDACEHAHSIGPRPDGRSETVQLTVHLRDVES
jgi:colicin import membrane protein